MIKGYKDFYYNVTDMNRAVKFYTEALGMKKTFGDKYWTSMQAGGKILGEANQDWGHMLVFEDLDGNVLKLMNPKY